MTSIRCSPPFVVGLLEMFKTTPMLLASSPGARSPGPGPWSAPREARRESRPVSWSAILQRSRQKVLPSIPGVQFFREAHKESCRVARARRDISGAISGRPAEHPWSTTSREARKAKYPSSPVRKRQDGSYSRAFVGQRIETRLLLGVLSGLGVLCFVGVLRAGFWDVLGALVLGGHMAKMPLRGNTFSLQPLKTRW